jgi:predicted nucleic acid-binding protein
MGITSIVWFEMIGGAHDKSDQRAVMRFLAAFELVCLTESDQLRAMKQYEVFLLSHGVGMNDCLIAAPAERLGVPLYTRNLKHFTPLLGDLAVMAYG